MRDRERAERSALIVVLSPSCHLASRFEQTFFHARAMYTNRLMRLLADDMKLLCPTMGSTSDLRIDLVRVVRTLCFKMFLILRVCFEVCHISTFYLRRPSG